MEITEADIPESFLSDGEKILWAHKGFKEQTIPLIVYSSVFIMISVITGLSFSSLIVLAVLLVISVILICIIKSKLKDKPYVYAVTNRKIMFGDDGEFVTYRLESIKRIDSFGGNITFLISECENTDDMHNLSVYQRCAFYGIGNPEIVKGILNDAINDLKK